MFRKIIALAAVVAVVGIVANAGFDQYFGKTYTTLLKPTAIGTSWNAGSTTTNTAGVVTNSTYTGVDCVGLVGRGALVISCNPGNGAAGGVISVAFSTCDTTNGTYATVTNASGSAAWAVTTTAAYVVAPIVPNAQSRYWRVTATATSVTNGNVGAILVTE